MNTAAPQPAWRSTLAIAVLAFCAVLALLWQTSLSLYATWMGSATYTHGFVILPISLWLIWDRRREIAQHAPHPTARTWPLVALAVIAWVLATLTGVQVVAQLALVTLLILVLVSVIGWHLARHLAFPLLFLYLAVPVGEDLVDPLMEFTASFTVWALQSTGIPVYREGLWFSLPSGNWSVVEACSGVRYLIASVTLGFLYAYISYHTLWKRIAFVLLSAAVPILANGIRAYIIVMIGHLSNMEYATGVDHLIYGWVFFGIVMLLLFWIGSFWQERQPAIPFRPERDDDHGSRSPLLPVAIGLALIGLGAGYVAAMQAPTADAGRQYELQPVAGVAGWRRLAEPPGLSLPSQAGAVIRDGVYVKDGQRVALYLRLFPDQKQGAEAVGFGNKVAPDHVPGKAIRLGTRTSRDIVHDGGSLPVNAYDLLLYPRTTRAVEHHLVWQWYRAGGRFEANAYLAKLHEALARVYPGRTDGAWIAIAHRKREGAADSTAVLEDFVNAMLPGVGRALDSAVER